MLAIRASGRSRRFRPDPPPGPGITPGDGNIHVQQPNHPAVVARSFPLAYDSPTGDWIAQLNTLLSDIDRVDRDEQCRRWKAIDCLAYCDRAVVFALRRLALDYAAQTRSVVGPKPETVTTVEPSAGPMATVAFAADSTGLPSVRFPQVPTPGSWRRS